MNFDIDAAFDLIRQTLLLTLLLSSPILLCGLVVGVAVSLVQALTQIQEQTLVFVPKIITMFAAAAVTLPWLSRHLMDFAEQVFTQALIP